MMTDDEIEEIRESYWGRPGSDQERKIRSLLAHIDEQASQIATLKAICIKERNRYLVDFIHEFDHIMDCADAANDQLAKEYPEIFAEETK